MGKVVAGFFSFTEITDPREHRRYNEWHQFDHLPEQYRLDGVAFGQRWVCTPSCVAARAASAPFLAPIHYVTLYLLRGPLTGTLDEFFALGRRLHDAGRFHEHRRSHLSGPFHVETQASSRPNPVDAKAVPYVPNQGIYVIVQPNGHPTEQDARTVERRATLLEHAGVLGLWTFAAGDIQDARWRTGDHRITVVYLDTDPVGFADDVASIVAPDSEDGSGLVYAGPFETITPRQWDWFDTT